MRNNWIRVGCFLTGYNFSILKGCSEAAVRRLLRYTSAMLIICLLWAFIGYSFTNRYLKAGNLFSIIGLILMVIIVIQIERQVILSSTHNKASFVLRMVIAGAMALIGSIIIDQILFKDDIEQQQILMMSEKVDRVFPEKASELRRQISEMDSTILSKERERIDLVNDISNNPTITVYTKQIRTENTKGNEIDSLMKEETTRKFDKIANPKIALVKPIDDRITDLRLQKSNKEMMLLGLRPAVEAELKANVGFLEELTLMSHILRDSPIAFIAWMIWFILLFGLEIFILISKWNEHDTDYDKMLEMQMSLHFRRIELLNKQ